MNIYCTYCNSSFVLYNTLDLCIPDATAYRCPQCNLIGSSIASHIPPYGIKPNVEIYNNYFNYYYLPFVHNNSLYILKGVDKSRFENDKTIIYKIEHNQSFKEIYLYSGPFFQTSNFQKLIDFYHKIIKLKAFS